MNHLSYSLCSTFLCRVQLAEVKFVGRITMVCGHDRMNDWAILFTKANPLFCFFGYRISISQTAFNNWQQSALSSTSNVNVNAIKYHCTMYWTFTLLNVHCIYIWNCWQSDVCDFYRSHYFVKSLFPDLQYGYTYIYLQCCCSLFIYRRLIHPWSLKIWY